MVLCSHGSHRRHGSQRRHGSHRRRRRWMRLHYNVFPGTTWKILGTQYQSAARMFKTSQISPVHKASPKHGSGCDATACTTVSGPQGHTDVVRGTGLHRLSSSCGPASWREPQEGLSEPGQVANVPQTGESRRERQRSQPQSLSSQRQLDPLTGARVPGAAERVQGHGVQNPERRAAACTD